MYLTFLHINTFIYNNLIVKICQPEGNVKGKLGGCGEVRRVWESGVTVNEK